MKAFIKRTVILLLIGMVPGVVAANQPDPITLLRRAKSLGSLSSLHTENVLKASSHLQQTVSRAMKASIDYTPMQPDMQMPFLTSTFQARITGKERANCFSGTVFQIDYEGQKEIYYAIGHDKESVAKLPQMDLVLKKEYDVLILSDDTVDSDSYDANVFVTLIALQTAFVKRNRHELSFVTELLDSKNLNSINDFNIKNAIISNRMMSLLLSQLCLNKDSKKFFDGLLITDTEEGGDYFDIKIEKISNMVNDESLEFNSKAELIHSFYVSFNRKYMLLGYIKEDQVYFIPKNQDNQEKISLTPDDSFIFIKY